MIFSRAAKRPIEILYKRLGGQNSSCYYFTLANNRVSTSEIRFKQLSPFVTDYASSVSIPGLFLRRYNSSSSSSEQMTLIKQLRERTSAPMKDVKSALVDCNWDIGLGRIAGLLSLEVEDPNASLDVLQSGCSELAMHVVVAKPRFLKKELVFNWASQQANFSHSSASYHSVLKSLSVSFQFDALEKVLKQARSRGILIDPSVYGSIIVSRVKAGQTLEGFQLFTEVAPFIKDVGAGCCNSLLAALASHGYVDHANKVFDEMLVKGVSFSSLGFGVFIWRFCKDTELDRALGLWTEVRKGISEINDSIVAVLLAHGLCQAGKMLDAQCALEELTSRGCKPDFLAYRVVAEGLRSIGYMAEVETVLKKKRKFGVAPRANEYRQLIFALIFEGRIELAKELGQVIVDGDFPMEDDVLNALASSVSAVDPCSAMFFLQYMIEKERMPTLLVLSNFGKNLCDHGKVDELVEILQKLSSYGYFMDVKAYSVMVSLLCKAGKVREVYGVLREMKKNGLNPDISSYNELMETLCREDLLRPARRLWDEMFANGIIGNVQTYTILIKKFSETGQFEEALVLLNHMLEKGLTPDAITYRSLLESLCQDGKIEAASQIFQKAVEQDQTLPGTLLAPLVLSLCEGGHLLSASRLLCVLNYNGVLVEPHVILLKYLADAGQVPLAVEHVKRINSALLLQSISSELLSLVSLSSNPDPILQLHQEIYGNNIIPVHDGWKELSHN